MSASSSTRLVLLGATGFLGRALAREFRGTIVAPSRATLDLECAESSRALAALLDPSTVLVVAVTTRSRTDTLETFERNLAILASVARAVRERRHRKCIYLSSASVFSTSASDLTIQEGTALRPESAYGMAKASGEWLLAHATRASGTPFAILRPCRVFGPGDDEATYGPSAFARTAIESGEVRLWGEGIERRDHIFVDDLVRVLLAFIEGGPELVGTVNVATGESRSYLEIVALLRQLVGGTLRVVHAPRSGAPVDQGFCVERLHALLPNLSLTSLQRGLESTLAAALAAARRSP